MKRNIPCLLMTAALATMPLSSLAQQGDPDSEALKLAAIEALMTASPERALPVIQRVLASDASDEIKSRALFVLGQNGLPEANETLLQFAASANDELQLEAIRAIGINGDRALSAQLGDIYTQGNPEVREAVLEAWMIAGDEEALYQVAANATTDEEFEAAVQQLGIIGATEELAKLRDRPGATESLVEAYAIAGDTQSLLVMARDDSDPRRQVEAIQGLGIVGADDIPALFYELYTGTDNTTVKQAVMHGMLMADDDETALRLFREATDTEEKTELLRLLVSMDSEAAIDAIDAALMGDNGEQP